MESAGPLFTLLVATILQMYWVNGMKPSTVWPATPGGIDTVDGITVFGVQVIV